MWALEVFGMQVFNATLNFAVNRIEYLELTSKTAVASQLPWGEKRNSVVMVAPGPVCPNGKHSHLPS